MATLIGVLMDWGGCRRIARSSRSGFGHRPAAEFCFPLECWRLPGALVTLAMTTWPRTAGPADIFGPQADLITSQVSLCVCSRESSTSPSRRLVLYVNDVTASGTQWHGVFMAETGGEGGFTP